MLNVNELKGAIAREGLSQKDVAHAIGMSEKHSIQRSSAGFLEVMRFWL